MIKRKKSKLGVALENAIFFMMVTFTLCALLATVVLVGNNYNSLSQNAFLDRVALSQAIESAPYTKENAVYTSEKNGNEIKNEIKVYNKAGELVLTVVVENGKITSRTLPEK